jgi:Rrf2 family protein
LIPLPPGTSLGIKELAEYQGVSETYLSKIFTKLKKAGIVRSMPGMKGGYELARRPDAITFWDVVEAIEGAKPLFQCTEIRQRGPVARNLKQPLSIWKAPCIIHATMLEAELRMRDFLKEKTLAWLAERLMHQLPREAIEEASKWFQDALARR